MLGWGYRGGRGCGDGLLLVILIAIRRGHCGRWGELVAGRWSFVMMFLLLSSRITCCWANRCKPRHILSVLASVQKIIGDLNIELNRGINIRLHS